MIFSFLSGDDLVFVLARKDDAKNNERETTLPKLHRGPFSLFLCAQKPRWKFFSFDFFLSFVCCVREKTVDFEYEGKVPYWTLKCGNTLFALFSLSHSSDSDHTLVSLSLSPFNFAIKV